MTDLIKNEAEFIRNCATDIETGEPLEDDQLCNLYVIDAHRIADLIDAVEARNKELTLQLLATSGQAADALDKLTKAVEVLQSISAQVKASKLPIAGLILYKCTKALAELEGTE